VFAREHESPWGGGLEFDGPDGAMLRRFFVDNAVHWIREYHLDGLRLDATHAIVERGRPTFVAELAGAARAAAPGRRVLVIAEDRRNEAALIQPAGSGGWGLDAVSADDFHHQVRRHLTGDFEGFYADYTGTTRDLADTIAHGWFYRGAFAPFVGAPRGTGTDGIPRERFVICIQNHDQIGNRALGERLNHQVPVRAFAAASALLLLAPETPLLFMGQEWAALSPFLYFSDHTEPLGMHVVEGRRQEFRHFASFRTPEAAARIPSPQEAATFERSRLDWSETSREPHRRVLRLYRDLIALRRRMRRRGVRGASPAAADPGSLALRHVDSRGRTLYVTLVRLSGHGRVACTFDPEPDGTHAPRRRDWTVALATDARLSDSPAPVRATVSEDEVAVELDGPGAVVLARRRGKSGAQP
jgi:maltooligosyltrehalose trehalohydrolase